jgi:hypothetical protein
MYIVIKSNYFSTFIISDINENDTIGDIKKKIFEKKQVPHDEQNLIYKNIILRDDTTLQSNNIKNEDTLWLLLKK